jgi:hypothetical protein
LIIVGPSATLCRACSARLFAYGKHLPLKEKKKHIYPAEGEKTEKPADFLHTIHKPQYYPPIIIKI